MKLNFKRIQQYIVGSPGYWLLCRYGFAVALLRGGRVLLTEILLPRIARQGTACLVSIRG